MRREPSPHEGPSRWVSRLLAAFLPPGAAGASLLGDLHEEYLRFQPGARRDLWYVAVASRLATLYAAAAGWRCLVNAARWLVAAPSQEMYMLEDLRYALRFFRHRPGFTAVALATLALGIGATTAIFTVVDAALLRPLPYERPGELFTVWNTYPSWRGHGVLDRYWDHIALSYPEYVAWRDGQTSFAGVAACGATTMALTGRGEPAELVVGLASSSLFPLLGVEPHHGRGFAADEEGAGASPVAVVSHRLWQAHLGGDPAVLGGTLMLDGEPFTVVGVLPPRFRFRILNAPPEAPPTDLWIPIGADGAELDEGHHVYEAIARLDRGASAASAFGEAEGHLRGGRDPAARGARMVPRVEAERGATRRPLLLLLASVGLLMLIASINIATVLLGEVTRRQRELATRAALGAGRMRLVRQLITESVLLGGLGTVAGLGVAHVAVTALLRYAPADLHLPPEVTIDMRVLLFSSALGIVTGVTFGLVPAWVAGRSDVRTGLRGGVASGRATGGRFQQALIVGEVALALVLLVSAGLLGRSFVEMFQVEPGFVADELVTQHVTLPGTRYASDDALAFFSELRRDVAALPGVEAVSGSSRLPFSGRVGSGSFEIEGRATPPDGKHPEAHRQTVLPGFHEVMGIPLVAGRTLAEGDGPAAPSVVVISQSMARRFWPGESPLGARILRDDRSWEVVGVVGDVLDSDLTGDAKPTFYFPFLQQPMPALTLVVRSRLDLAVLAPALRETVWRADPELPIEEIGTLPGLVAKSARLERYRAFLLAVFGAGATLLTGIGIFGVTARAVASRTRELGIRVALGAPRDSIVALVVRREAAALIFGVGLGVAGSLAAGQALTGFLFGVAASDPLTLVAASLFLVALGLVASYLPARRALLVSPSRVLRAE